MKPFDSNGNFHPTGEDGGLRRRAVRGAGVTVLSQGVVFAIQLVATIVLARLLTPADFGVVTMVTTFSLLLVRALFFVHIDACNWALIGRLPLFGYTAQDSPSNATATSSSFKGAAA